MYTLENLCNFSFALNYCPSAIVSGGLVLEGLGRVAVFGDQLS